MHRVKFLTSVLFVFFTYTVSAEQLKIEVEDCGPVARAELGVTFKTKPHGFGKSYLTKGKAYDVCPKLTSAKKVLGYVEDICKNHKPRNAKECGKINVFVVKKYISK